jgi:hypothetical protein
MLLAAWDARRATVDADFLVRNLNLDEDSVLRRIVEIAALPASVEDGVEFRPDTVTANSIRDGDLHGAGAASLTQLYNVAASHGQPGWLAWADAIALELMSIASGLELRRRRTPSCGRRTRSRPDRALHRRTPSVSLAAMNGAVDRTSP